LFLAFCVFAYFTDDAGENVRTGTDCTQFPLIMIADVALTLIWLLFFASTMLCSVQGFDEESGLEEKIKSAGALFAFVKCTSIAAMTCAFGMKVWATIEYFRIDSTCWDIINNMGSPVFKIACQIYGIVCLLSVCSVAIAIFCCSFILCLAASAGEVRADRQRLLDHEGA